MTIHEILQFGPIVVSDPDLDLIVTVNGAYFNVWVAVEDGYDNTEAYDRSSRIPGDSLDRISLGSLMDAAEKVLAEFMVEAFVD